MSLHATQGQEAVRAVRALRTLHDGRGPVADSRRVGSGHEAVSERLGVVQASRPNVPGPWNPETTTVAASGRLADSGGTIRGRRCRLAPQNVGSSFVSLAKRHSVCGLSWFSCVWPGGAYGATDLAYAGVLGPMRRTSPGAPQSPSPQRLTSRSLIRRRDDVAVQR